MSTGDRSGVRVRLRADVLPGWKMTYSVRGTWRITYTVRVDSGQPPACHRASTRQQVPLAREEKPRPATAPWLEQRDT